MPSATPKPVPGATAWSQRIEVEDVDFNVSTLVSGHGSTGTFIDFFGETYIEWPVTVPEAGEYNIQFGYALHKGNRPLDLIIDGKTLMRLDFPATKNWSTWETFGAKATLSKGPHTIRLKSTGRSGGNFDYMDIELIPPPTTSVLMDQKPMRNKPIRKPGFVIQHAMFKEVG